MDALANRYANWARSQNLKRGQTVALFMPNRLEYFPIWYGLSKVGVVTALINNNLAGAPLVHCLNISGASHVIVDSETSPMFEGVRTQTEKHFQQWVLGPAHGDQRDLVQALKSCSQLAPAGRGAKPVRSATTIAACATFSAASRYFSISSGGSDNTDQKPACADSEKMESSQLFATVRRAMRHAWWRRGGGCWSVMTCPALPTTAAVPSDTTASRDYASTG